MEERDKYYVPSIEEFHVGFEFQKWEVHNLYYQTLTMQDTTNLTFIKERLQEIRVKYLDKEDIESLGFELWKIQAGTTTHEFQTYDSKYYITFDPYFGNTWNITIEDEVDFVFFHGYIKNKSELKFILKSIGVLEENKI